MLYLDISENSPLLRPKSDFSAVLDGGLAERISALANINATNIISRADLFLSLRVAGH